MLPRILCIDDEKNVLEGLKRQLRNDFNVDIAIGCKPALELMKSNSYSVVISDLRMPEIDGIECLRQIKQASPDSVRIMLTGNADQESAIRAVNEGNIFRFLSKPCPTEQLKKALGDALEQYRLVIAERELLENTLNGSIKLLIDILSLTSSGLFDQSLKVRHLTQKLKAAINATDIWETELASMLFNIGLITVPPEILKKLERKEKLNRDEKILLDQMPAIGQSLIENIPRLHNVAEIVLYQDKNFDGSNFPTNTVKGIQIPFGARFLKIVKDLLGHEAEGKTREQALKELKSQVGQYDTEILDKIIALLTEKVPEVKSEGTKIFEINSAQLLPGQILQASIETNKGLLLATAGSVLTETNIARILNYARFAGIKEPIKVDCLTPVAK